MKLTLRHALADFLDIDVNMITDYVLDDEDILFFIILNKEQFSIYLDEYGNLLPDSLKHLGTYPDLEEPPF